MGSLDNSIRRIPELIGRLYSVVDELEDLFPGRHFTPDGHMVGSIGEVWAAYLYGLELATASTPGFDAKAMDGRNVEIKATQVTRVSLRSEPEHLIVLKLNRTNEPEEVFNGPGVIAWNQAGKMQSNGQRSIGVIKLGRLMEEASTNSCQVIVATCNSGPYSGMPGDVINVPGDGRVSTEI